jgi:hypothetical protein
LFVCAGCKRAVHCQCVGKNEHTREPLSQIAANKDVRSYDERAEYDAEKFITLEIRDYLFFKKIENIKVEDWFASKTFTNNSDRFFTIIDHKFNDQFQQRDDALAVRNRIESLIKTDKIIANKSTAEKWFYYQEGLFDSYFNELILETKILSETGYESRNFFKGQCTKIDSLY